VLPLWVAPVTPVRIRGGPVSWHRGEGFSTLVTRLLILYVRRNGTAWVWRVDDESSDPLPQGRAPTQSIAEKEATAAARALLQADLDALGAA
jgi:hypothetical protein